MRLELTGRHIDITPGVRRIVENKLAKLERVLNDSALSAQIVITREKNVHRVDVTLHARGEKFLHGVGRGAAVATGMVQAVEKIGQQARRVKGKFEGRKRFAARSEATPAEAPAAARVTAAAPAARSPRPRMPRILKAERQTVRTMSISDAAAQIDGGAGPVVFLDVETARVAVLYRAPGGDLTLIETKA